MELGEQEMVARGDDRNYDNTQLVVVFSLTVICSLQMKEGWWRKCRSVDQ